MTAGNDVDIGSFSQNKNSNPSCIPMKQIAKTWKKTFDLIHSDFRKKKITRNHKTILLNYALIFNENHEFQSNLYNFDDLCEFIWSKHVTFGLMKEMNRT